MQNTLIYADYVVQFCRLSSFNKNNPFFTVQKIIPLESVNILNETLEKD